MRISMCSQIKHVILDHLKVVDRGSETQLQVGEHLNKIRYAYGTDFWSIKAQIGTRR